MPRLFSRMVALLVSLKMALGDFSLREILAVLQSAANLLPLPDPADEAATKFWVDELLSVADDLADLTETDADDDTIDVARIVLDSEIGWRIAYPAIRAALQNLPFEPPAMATLGEDSKLAAIDPATIIAIITAVVELIKILQGLRR